MSDFVEHKVSRISKTEARGCRVRARPMEHNLDFVDLVFFEGLAERMVTKHYRINLIDLKNLIDGVEALREEQGAQPIA